MTVFMAVNISLEEETTTTTTTRRYKEAESRYYGVVYLDLFDEWAQKKYRYILPM